MDKFVHEFDKSSTEKVCFSVSEFKGSEYVNIRIYFEADDGEWRPTKKGITVSTELVDELYQGISKLRVKVNGR